MQPQATPRAHVRRCSPPVSCSACGADPTPAHIAAAPFVFFIGDPPEELGGPFEQDFDVLEAPLLPHTYDVIDYGLSQEPKASALARDAGCKIVPVAHNAGDFWPRRGIVKRPGKIRFVIGPPIAASGQAPKETNLIVQEWIEAKMHEISNIYKQKQERP